MPGINGGRTRQTVALLVVSISLLVAAVPADAYLRNLTVRSKVTPSTSSTFKTDLVPVAGCPGPIFGGGAFVSPGFANLGLTQTMPFGGLLTGAAETDPVAGSWRLSSRAFCAEQVGGLPQAGETGPFFKFMQFYGRTSANNSSEVKTVIAQCPAPNIAITGGGEIDSAVSKQAFQSHQRVNGGTAWRVVAREIDPTNANWAVKASVVCVNATTPSNLPRFIGPTAQQFNPPTAFNSNSPKTLLRQCPPPQEAIGGGARATGAGFDDPPPRGVVITRSVGAYIINGKYTWVTEARETKPTNQSWRLNANVTCAYTNAG